MLNFKFSVLFNTLCNLNNIRYCKQSKNRRHLTVLKLADMHIK